MNAVVKNIKGIMVVSGGLTATVAYAAVAPAAALQSTFGESLSGPVGELLVRNWGVLVGLLGILLIHGAFNPATRRAALIAGGLSKVWFIALVLANGTRFLGHGAGTAVVADTIMVALYATYLMATRHDPMALPATRAARAI